MTPNDPPARRRRAAWLACAVVGLLAGPLRAADSGGNPAPPIKAAPALPAQPATGAGDNAANAPAQSQSLRLDPDTAAKLATSQSPAVIAAALNVSSKAADLEANRLIWRPTIALQNATNYGRGESTSFQAVQKVNEPGVPSGFAEGRFMANTLSVSLPLYFNGTLISRDTPAAIQAEGNLTAAQETINLQAAAAANLVVKAYFNAALGIEQVGIFQTEYTSKLQELEIVRQRVVARISPLSDQLVIESAVAAALAGLNTAKTLLETSLVQFRSILGLPPATDINLAPVGDEAPAVTALAKLLDKTLVEHPQIKLQQALVQVARGAWLQAKGNYEPTLTFATSYTGANNMVQYGSGPTFFSSGITLSVPITDFGQSDAKIRAKYYALSESEQQLLVVRSTITQSMAGTYQTLLAAKEQVPAAKVKLDQLKYTEQVTQAEYDLGKVSLDKLIDDQNKVLIQQTVLLSAKYNVWGAYADLVSVAGKPYSSQAFSASQ